MILNHFEEVRAVKHKDCTVSNSLKIAISMVNFISAALYDQSYGWNTASNLSNLLKPFTSGSEHSLETGDFFRLLVFSLWNLVFLKHAENHKTKLKLYGK